MGSSGNGGGGSGRGGSDGGSDGGDTPASIAFSFMVGDPSVTLSAHATTSVEREEITIDDYPYEVTTNVRLNAAAGAFSDFFKPGFCDTVRTNALAARQGDAAAKKLVRDDGNVSIRMTMSPLFGPGLENAAEAGARRAGAIANAPEIANPLNITKATLAATIASDAMSNLIGTTEAIVSPLIQSFNRDLDGSLSGAELALTISAKDFVCDLQTGKVTLEINLAGKVRDDDWQGKTLTSGVVRL